jgi:hypothetical protein
MRSSRGHWRWQVSRHNRSVLAYAIGTAKMPLFEAAQASVVNFIDIFAILQNISFLFFAELDMMALNSTQRDWETPCVW